LPNPNKQIKLLTRFSDMKALFWMPILTILIEGSYQVEVNTFKAEEVMPTSWTPTATKNAL